MNLKGQLTHLARFKIAPMVSNGVEPYARASAAAPPGRARGSVAPRQQLGVGGAGVGRTRVDG